jgi:uncharacterized damage-inducible protein DinB
MKQTKWFERTFDFSTTQNIFPSIVKRLWGTPARLEEKVSSLDEVILTMKKGKAWSIKENIGHLSDLEPLWQGRLEDILNGENFMRSTDLANSITEKANHNAASLQALLTQFRQTRKDTLQKLEKLTEEHVFLSALHPRLKTPMRTMDLFLFVAEHDDHHLLTITEILQSNSK